MKEWSAISVYEKNGDMKDRDSFVNLLDVKV